MAPNRKLITSIDTSSLGIDYAQVAFLPLTTPVKAEEQQKQQQQAEPKQLKEDKYSTSSDSYWEWESSDVVDDNVYNTSKDLFSVSFLESNLIREAEVLKETLARKATVNTVTRNCHDDDYWAEKVEDDINDEYDIGVNNKDMMKSNLPQQLEGISYWDWPSVDPREVQISLILRDEHARQQVSVESIQRRLLKDRRKTFSVKKLPEQQKVSSDSYWIWDSPIVPGMDDDNNFLNPNHEYWMWEESNKSKKSSMIESILEKESIRRLLCVEHIQQGIMKDLSLMAPICYNKSECNDYWSWESSEETDDMKNYWDWNPIDNESYWVM